MQGIIASLLALMMTGMVFSQQPQPGGRSATSTKPVGFLLIIDEPIVQSLKTHGFRSADVEPKNIDRILFFSDELTANQPNIDPDTIQPVAPTDGDQTLVFELDDRLLGLMRKRGLTYMLQPQEIGRYKVLTIKYVGQRHAVRTQHHFPTTSNQITKSRQTQSSQGFASDQYVEQTPSRIGREYVLNSGNTSQRFAPNTDRDENYYGPRLPDDWDQRSTVDPQNSGDTGSFRPRIGSIATRRQESPSFQSTPDRNGGMQRMRSTEYIRDRFANNNYDSRSIDPTQDRYPNRVQTNRNLNNEMPVIREQINHPQFRNEQYRNQLNDRMAANDRIAANDRMVANDRMAANTPFDSRAIRNQERLPATRGFDSNTDQLPPANYDPVFREELRIRDAENRSLDRINQNLADQNEELRKRLDEQRAATQRREIAYVRDPRAAAYDREDYVYEPPRRRRISGDPIIVQPPINSTETMPDRVAVSPRPTNRLLPFAIEGPSASNSNDTQESESRVGPVVDSDIVANAENYRKQNAALWFIMLCSVGLNFYLAWIARGFYVRYEELADDIRETFTSSL